MKNADKPAMPTPYMDQNSNGGALYCDDTGLTKREMFAMHIAGHMVSRTAGYDEYVKSKMKTAVEYANALLAELEK